FYFQAQLEKIPVSDDTYDHVILRYVFEHLSDPQAVIREAFRVLKKGGRIFVINFDGVIANLHPLSTELSILMQDFHSRFPVDLFIGRKIPSLLSELGFQSLSYRVDAHSFQGRELLE